MPEAVEESAWVGTRWRIRRHTFAHVLTIEDGWPAADARAAGTDGTVLTFRATGAELDALSNAGRPFFKPQWFRDIVGMVLGAETCWDEVGELVTDSSCVVAPRTLAASVHVPGTSSAVPPTEAL